MDDFLEELSKEEYQRWCEYYRREPWGTGPLDDLLSQLLALTHNLHSSDKLAPSQFGAWAAGRKLDQKVDLKQQAMDRKKRFMRGRKR